MSFRHFILVLALVGMLAAVAAPVVHIVKAGETLAVIARCYDVEPADIARANHLRNPNRLIAGQHLTIPQRTKPLEHRVRRGQTLGLIARRYGVPLSAVIRANGLTDPNRVIAGQCLIIPPPAPPVGITAITVTPSRIEAGWHIIAGSATLFVQATGAEKVKFFVTPTGTNQPPRLLGMDATPADGWTLPWEPQPGATRHVWAVAYAADGTYASSELLNVYRE